MIRLSGVGKTYADGTVAVHDLDLEVGRGELVCFVGPSGCGKSDDAEDDQPADRAHDRDASTIDGEDVTHAGPGRLRRGIGYVIQQVGPVPAPDGSSHQRRRRCRCCTASRSATARAPRRTS